MKLNSTKEIIEDIKAGKMVVIMDDEDRENEGDILMAAEAVTADAINFMAKYGRGLICLTLTEQRCLQLRLPLMVGDNKAQMETNFTMSIEAAKGVTTGISASDRATTVLAAVKADACPEDIVQPGHVFPIMARKGGVLPPGGNIARQAANNRPHSMPRSPKRSYGFTTKSGQARINISAIIAGQRLASRRWTMAPGS